MAGASSPGDTLHSALASPGAAATMPQTIRVEVIYALPARSWRVAVVLAEGAHVADAIREAALDRLQIPGWGTKALEYAVFGKPIAAGGVLRDGDRVELLRPLAANPMETRRRRALG